MVKLSYFDESGVSLTPCVPYAWQKEGETLEIPSKRSKRLNILGFMNRNNQGYFHYVEGSVTSAHVIAAFDQFARDYSEEYARTGVPHLVVLDNASMHHSALFRSRVEDWMAQGICLHYLPPYSPELNLIEILWRKLKFEWLPNSAYTDRDTLCRSVKKILSSLGEKYMIIFG